MEPQRKLSKSKKRNVLILKFQEWIYKIKRKKKDERTVSQSNNEIGVKNNEREVDRGNKEIEPNNVFVFTGP